MATIMDETVVAQVARGSQQGGVLWNIVVDEVLRTFKNN